MTRAEFLKGWDKLLLNYPLPRQVWQYQGIAPAGLFTPDRFMELYFEEVNTISASEFEQVINEYIAHSGSRNFPLVPDIKRIHMEMYWFKHQQERDDQERERAIKENREAEERYEWITEALTAWPTDKRGEFFQRRNRIQEEQVPNMFRECKVLTDIAHKKATIQAYEEMTK